MSRSFGGHGKARLTVGHFYAAVAVVGGALKPCQCYIVIFKYPLYFRVGCRFWLECRIAAGGCRHAISN